MSSASWSARVVRRSLEADEGLLILRPHGRDQRAKGRLLSHVAVEAHAPDELDRQESVFLLNKLGDGFPEILGQARTPDAPFETLAQDQEAPTEMVEDEACGATGSVSACVNCIFPSYFRSAFREFSQITC